MNGKFGLYVSTKGKLFLEFLTLGLSKENSNPNIIYVFLNFVIKIND